MPIFRYTSRPEKPTSWNIDTDSLDQFQKIEDYPTEILRLKKNARVFHDVSVENLMDFFDTLAKSWISETPDVLRTFSFLGTPFLLAFMRKSNLLRLARAALRGNPEYMDTFTWMPELGKNIMAQPRGIVSHWIAGNVLNLGIISLIQGILTKNANVIKLPAYHGLIIPALFHKISNLELNTAKNRRISGKDILKTILFLYCPKEDTDGQRELSLFSDIRVIWGGEQAVASVLGLPKKISCDDVVFGPRYSLAVIGKETLRPEDLDTIAFKLAMDVSMFEQRACSSPHTVFVEAGGLISPLDFAEALARGMQKALKRIPKDSITADLAYSIIALRSEYQFSGKVFSSKGTEWTVAYSEEKGLAFPCGSRFVFVRPVLHIDEVLDDIDPSIQTVGLRADSRRKMEFAKKVVEKGGLRITDIGKMNVYDYPWDGIFPMSRFVRWISLDP
jgi:hypothetical protein